MKDTHATTRFGFNNDAAQDRSAGALIGHLSGMVRDATLLAQSQRCYATHEQVAERAYDIYCKTGRKAGHCEDNWHQAHKELRREIYAENASSRGDTPYLDGLQASEEQYAAATAMPTKRVTDKLPPFSTQQTKPPMKR